MYLDAKGVSELQTGDQVRVTWSGGNGPHVYRVKRDERGSILACIDGLPDGYPGTLYDGLDPPKIMIHNVEKC